VAAASLNGALPQRLDVADGQFVAVSEELTTTVHAVHNAPVDDTGEVLFTPEARLAVREKRAWP